MCPLPNGRGSDSEDDIEIGREAPPSLAEEEPVGWVGDIVMKSLRVEMIREVVTAHGQSDRVLLPARQSGATVARPVLRTSTHMI